MSAFTARAVRPYRRAAARIPLASVPSRPVPVASRRSAKGTYRP